LYYLQIVRAIVIVRIITRHALINWMSGKRMLRGLIPKRYKRNGVINSEAERLRIAIEELGPTFIKFGQILADRPDMVSEKLRFELKKLQASAVPFDDRYAMQLIEKELGGPIDKFFEFFDTTCIGSASIGQVYKAVLIGGEEVIVKIQRPNIETKIKLDLYLMKFIARKAVKEYPGLAAMDIVGFVEEFEVTLMQEMDYFNEASNAVRFAEMFRDVPYCKVPQVHLDLSTRKLLVMEFVYGISPDDIDKIDSEGLDRKKIAENGTHILLRMILKHGFFHADPHAGNLFVQYDNSIVIIDFGMVGSLKPTHMNFLASFTLGMAMSNARTIADALLTLCGKKFFPERDDLEFSLQEMMNRHGYLPYDKINFSAILNDCIQIMLRYQLRLPSSIYLLLKALATIEKFGYNLDPDISLPKIIRPYAENLIQQKFSLKNVAGDIYDILKDYMALVRDFPGEVNEILYRVKQGKLVHDIQIKDSTPFVKSAREFGRIVSIALLLGFMLAGSAIMIVWGKQVWIGHTMFAISSVFALWVLLRLFFKTRF
jgi:ubiquinone biosynthesis protein